MYEKTDTGNKPRPFPALANRNSYKHNAKSVSKWNPPPRHPESRLPSNGQNNSSFPRCTSTSKVALRPELSFAQTTRITSSITDNISSFPSLNHTALQST